MTRNAKAARAANTGAISYANAWLDASHAHTFTGNSIGGGAAHNNMPPYYALSYIEKI